MGGVVREILVEKRGLPRVPRIERHNRLRAAISLEHEPELVAPLGPIEKLQSEDPVGHDREPKALPFPGSLDLPLKGLLSVPRRSWRSSENLPRHDDPHIASLTGTLFKGEQHVGDEEAVLDEALLDGAVPVAQARPAAQAGEAVPLLKVSGADVA